MDETRETQHTASVDGVPTARQDALPFETVPPVALPYDDESDEPIGFSLTARARRAVAPHGLPSLAVVADDGDLDLPGDTRPARARALRRAGVSLADITRQLGVDELVVRAWVDGVPTRSDPPSRVPHRAADVSVLRAVTDTNAVTSTERSDGPGNGDVLMHDHADAAPGADADVAFDLARAAAADEGRARLRDDPAFAGGLGVTVALASVDRHAVTVAVDRQEIAEVVVAWLRDHAAVRPGDIRVVLQLGGTVAGDLERHRWSSGLGLPLDRVSHTRRGGRGARDHGVNALIRVHDPSLAATLAGWSDALLAPEPDPVDVAF